MQSADFCGSCRRTALAWLISGKELEAALLAATGRKSIDVVSGAMIEEFFANPTGRVNAVRCKRPDGTLETSGCKALVLARNGFTGYEARTALGGIKEAATIEVRATQFDPPPEIVARSFARQRRTPPLRSRLQRRRADAEIPQREGSGLTIANLEALLRIAAVRVFGRRSLRHGLAFWGRECLHWLSF